MSLVFDHVVVSQGGFRLELDVSLAAHVTGIFGPSGAGKTTLLDAVAGLRRLDAGKIQLGDRSLVDRSGGVFVPVHRRRIGYVPQDLALFPHLTVGGNLRYGRKPTETADQRFSIGAVSDLLEIGALTGRRISELSGGEKQRVALARALLSAPELLLLDEPLASLDSRLKQRILPFLRRIRDVFPIPILHVSHDPAEVRELCDEVLVLSGGRVVRQGGRESVPDGSRVSGPEP